MTNDDAPDFPLKFAFRIGDETREYVPARGIRTCNVFALIAGMMIGAGLALGAVGLF